ncbi:MAG: PEGA domain-containing protein, partial [Gemmataceae bacterium]|nr:PEGA domain-containing protein [Gemmataceae bacterium]
LIVSDPPGATVVVNGQNVGLTPASVPFTYYGKYDITLIRDGYQTKTYQARIRRPWFQFFPLDFAAEVLYPGHIQDNRTLNFQMEPMVQPTSEQIIRSAEAIRQRGQTLGPSEN